MKFEILMEASLEVLTVKWIETIRSTLKEDLKISIQVFTKQT